MPYADEELLEKREEAKKKKYQTLEDGIYLDGRVLSFERTGILDSFSVCLPDVMKIMPLDYARIKYPSEFRPQIIMTTEDLGVNIGFTEFPETVRHDDIGKLTERIRSVIHRANPNYILYSCESLSEVNGYWFSFRSHAMDSDLYNMMLTVLIGKKIVQGSFNCPHKDYLDWKSTVLMMWNSIMELRGV